MVRIGLFSEHIMRREGRRATGRFGSQGSERGVALLVVIMVILMVSFLASQLIMQVRAELKIAANQKSRAVSHFLATSGVNLSLFWLFGDKPLESDTGNEEEFLLGLSHEDYLPTGRVRYYAVSESGKIDLNTAPRPLLELFLEYQGLDEEQIDTVVDSLLDWRDADDMHRLNGAESETYQELEDPYIARNGNIEDPAEFFLVNGTEILRDKFIPEEVFTIHNGRNKINFNSLTPAMLDFLTGGDPDRQQAYREAQQLYGNLTSALAKEILGEERFGLFQHYLTYESRQHAFSQNPYYYIEATGQAGAVQDGEEGDLPGVKARVLLKIVGTTVQYLSWTEEFV